MNPISAFFVRNMVGVFFVYGLAFFSMGLALLLASRRPSEFRFAQVIPPLAAFGILHGIHEWFEMFQKIAALQGDRVPSTPEETIRLALLAVSFSALLLFGVLLLSPKEAKRRHTLLPMAGMVGLWIAASLAAIAIFQPTPSGMIALADVLTRYMLGVPGALLGVWALMAQQRTFREHGMPQFGRDLVWCAAALFLYGVLGQTFVRETALPPSTVVNTALFLQWFGIPVQLFRGVMATVLAVFMVRALNAFDLESQRRLEQANEAQLAAQSAALDTERRISREMERLNEELRRTAVENTRLYEEAREREKMLGDLLHQVVSAQESERQRIARELHDATGQSLTGIALGLRGVEAMLRAEQGVAAEQIKALRAFSTTALGELRQIISDLRPSQLDDLGLVAALQWYVQQFEQRYAIHAEFVVKGDRLRLPSEYETVLFRITQEALINIAKHAHAQHAAVSVAIHRAQVCVTIEDDGSGFDPAEVLRRDKLRSGWGLVGIQERTLLLGGQYEIDSAPGRGTRIRVTVPLVERRDGQDTAVAG